MNKKTIDKIMELVLVANAFLVPVIYLPLTSEFFELNKLALITVSTIILAILWMIKLLTIKKINTFRSPVNGALLAFLGIFVLGSVFSISPFVSTFGTYGRWFPSLFGLITMVVLYFAIASNVNRHDAIKNSVLALIAGISISSLHAVLTYFGVYLITADYAQTPNFNLMGSTTALGTMAAFATILGVTYLTNAKNIVVKTVLLVLTVPNIAILFLYNEMSTWVLFIVGIMLYLFIVKAERIKENLAYTTPVIAIVLVLTAAMAFGKVSEISNEEFFGDINLDFATSWKVSSTTMTDYPLLGAGPGTFATNYTIYKPAQVNLTDSWNIRFDKPFNEILNILGALGLLGAIAAIYFGYTAGRYALKSKEEPILAIGLLMSLTIFLVTYATVLNAFVMFLMLALLTARNAEKTSLSISTLSSMSLVSDLGVSASSQREILHYMGVLLLAVYAGIWSYYLYRDYSAEYYVRQSVVALQDNDILEAFNYQAQAIQLNGQRAEYRNTFAQTSLAIADALAGQEQEELTEEDVQQIQGLISQAIRETRISTEILNPLLAGSWEVRARIYSSLVGVAEDAQEWSLGAYDSAIRLDPNNPRLRLEAGGIYFVAEDYLTAANLFRQAVNLKPDYANARYNLAQALIQLENYELAQRELRVVLSLLPEGSEDWELVQRELEQIAPLVDEEALRPTIEELEGQEQEPTEQEPLTSPGELETVSLDDESEITVGDEEEVNEDLEE